MKVNVNSILDMCIGAVILAFAITLYGMLGDYEHPIEEVTEYEVSCVDGILTGRFLFIDGKYFRHGADKSTWIPFEQCGIEPVEVN